MSDKQNFTLDDWMFELPAGDYDASSGPVQEELDRRVAHVNEFCVEQGLPYCFIAATGARDGGNDTRRSSTGHSEPLNRVSPEVLMCNLIAQHGAEFFIQNFPEISQKIYGRSLFLGKLRQAAPHKQSDE